ncbi:mediator of DNA damage checkpoint protein 1-like [Patiria miniata]|uniref:Uncharacterized protein n=1 Tax=Patiria miniata TaxID=46514 RepID=A0A914BB88_PATMI|nr:mediator of DNA damage checkpoint protein 1-like [Patiria miniata]
MPPKRRTRVKAQGKQKSSKSKESSSEDAEQCTAEDIAKRLAKKYLLKSSTDTEQSDHKENEKAATRVGDPYDADLSDVDTAASVDTASDMECQEAQLVPRILSPSRRPNVPSTRTVTSKHANPSKSNRKLQQPVQPSARQVHPSSAKTLPSHRHDSRRPSATPEKTAPVRTPKEQHHSLESDSGLFVSPFTSLPRHCLPKMNASDTSTPTSACGDIRSDLNDSCFGFDSLMAPDPLAPISPVDPVSPPSHVSRSRSALSDVSLTGNSSASTSYSVVKPVKRKVSAAMDVTSLVQEKPQPVKKQKRQFKRDAVVHNSQKLCKAQEWAAQMAEEFEDIEMHELTIEA